MTDEQFHRTIMKMMDDAATKADIHQPSVDEIRVTIGKLIAENNCFMFAAARVNPENDSELIGHCGVFIDSEDPNINQKLGRDRQTAGFLLKCIIENNRGLVSEVMLELMLEDESIPPHIRDGLRRMMGGGADDNDTPTNPNQED